MNIFQNPVLVTLTRSDSFIIIQTAARSHGRSQRFYLSADAVSSLLRDEMPLPVLENDLLNFCTVGRIDDEITFRMFWLSSGIRDEVHGYRQQFSLPVSKAERVLAGETVKHLSHYEETGKVRLTIDKTAQASISEIAKDRLKRHALRRFFRDNLNYGRRERITIVADSWVNGFYFFNAFGSDGGIVPHETTVRGRDGKAYRKVTYSIHT